MCETSFRSSRCTSRFSAITARWMSHTRSIPPRSRRTAWCAGTPWTLIFTRSTTPIHCCRNAFFKLGILGFSRTVTQIRVTIPPMRWRIYFLPCLLALFLTAQISAQQSSPPPSAPPAKAPTKKSPATQPPAAPKSDTAPAESQDAAPDPDVELQLVVRQAGNDSAQLIKNLEAYLGKYPDSPRRGAIYRALLESEMTLHNSKSALEYAEKVIAIQPDDSQSMYVAVTLLEKLPEEASQLHAIDYDSRLIDRVSKADPDSRPQQMTLDDWQAGRNKFLVDLFVIRGRIEHHLHKNEDAAKDLKAGFNLIPNAEAALTLGEIAEEEKRADEAIRDYATAFILASQDQPDSEGPPLDRDSLRLRMGNLWRFSHDSTTGLGDIVLTAFDRNRETVKAEKADAPIYNKDVTD